jgi:hypothetical protein
VDGIIPAFETTHARMASPGEMTVDHVHHQLYTYNELFDIMVPAIVSSLSRHQAWGHGYALDETQGGGKDLGSDTT